MIFRYNGGKSKKQILEKIKSYFPKEYSEFREPFVGGGSVFFSIPLNKKRWINDKDEDLISVYSALKNRPNEFIFSCRAIEPPKENEDLAASKESSHKKSKNKALYNLRLKKIFDEFVQNTSIDPALRYYFINRVVWAGRVRYDLPSRLYYSNPNGWNIVKTDKLEKAANALRDTKITSLNYKELIDEPGEDVFIYADPPYYKNTLLAKTSQLYRYNFTIEDHVKLAEELTCCKHKVLLSYDNCDFIKKLYKNWNIFEEEWTYCGTSSSEEVKNKNKKKGKELLISNYEI